MPYEVKQQSTKTKHIKFSVAIQTDAYKNMINQTLGDPNEAKKFVSNISTAVSANPKLQVCDAGSIISAGLAANSLGLPINQALGFAYILPFRCKERDENGNEYWVDKAQFQIGYKGLIQLCLRSGQYKKIGVKPVHKGETQGRDEFGDEIIKFDQKFDNEPVVGYFAYFQLVNGAAMTSYKTVEECEKHGQKYSKSYKGLWTTNFDTMAMKTTLKLLLSKYGIMSTEMQNAIRYDQAVINTLDGKEVVDYVDNPNADEDTGEIVEEEVNPEMLATADIREQIKAKKGGE